MCNNKCVDETTRWHNSKVEAKLRQTLQLLCSLEIALNDDLSSEPSEEVRNLAQSLVNYFDQNRLYLFIGVNKTTTKTNNTFGVFQYFECFCKYIPAEEFDCARQTGVPVDTETFFKLLADPETTYNGEGGLTKSQYLQVLCCLKNHYEEVANSYKNFL